MDEFNQVSHVNTHDLFKVVEVSVIDGIIVAMCVLTAVVQCNLILTSVGNSSLWNISHVWSKRAMKFCIMLLNQLPEVSCYTWLRKRPWPC